jgi:hypothetical protein
MMEFDSGPFVDAGLDAGKLPGSYSVEGEACKFLKPFDLE